MQISGETCNLCGNRIICEADGTWCATCHTTFHRDCLAAKGGQCSTCKAPYVPAEALFRYAAFCPECMTPTVGKAANCPACRTRICWDTEAAYRQFKATHQEACRGLYTRGLGEMAFGIFMLGVFIGLIFIAEIAPFGLVWGLPLAVGMGSVADGLYRISCSRRLSKFA